jgi:hypothetical protein
MVFFFGGEREIISVDTVIGRFFVSHTHRLRGSQHQNGLGFDNETWLGLEFEAPVCLEEATDRMSDLLRFVEVMAGRPQNVEQVRLYAPRGGKPSGVDLYWLFRPRREAGWGHSRVSILTC